VNIQGADTVDTFGSSLIVNDLKVSGIGRATGRLRRWSKLGQAAVGGQVDARGEAALI
jgi:hypothetical protein